MNIERYADCRDTDAIQTRAMRIAPFRDITMNGEQCGVLEILGGKVEEGTLAEGAEVRIMRRDLELGRGTITSLQASKKQVKKVEAGSEFGAQVKTSAEPAAGDRLEVYTVTLK